AEDLAPFRRIRMGVETALRLHEMTEALGQIVPTTFDRGDLSEEPRDALRPRVDLGPLEGVPILLQRRREVPRGPQGIPCELRDDAGRERFERPIADGLEDPQQFGRGDGVEEAWSLRHEVLAEGLRVPSLEHVV